MFVLILSAAAIAGTPNSSGDRALRLCRPALARKISGDISEVRLEAVSKNGSSTVAHGTVTALIGMGEPGPGQASAHHLIRAQYDYSCWIRGGRVRKTSIKRLE